MCGKPSSEEILPEVTAKAMQDLLQEGSFTWPLQASIPEAQSELGKMLVKASGEEKALKMVTLFASFENMQLEHLDPEKVKELTQLATSAKGVILSETQMANLVWGLDDAEPEDGAAWRD